MPSITEAYPFSISTQEGTACCVPSTLSLKNQFELTSIKRSFYRYQPFGEPLLPVHRTAISRSFYRYYLFGEVLLGAL